MKQAILFSITLVLCALIAVGCCACRQRAKLAKPLVGTEWQLLQIMGREVSAEGDSFTLLFHDNGTVTGAGACNRLTATYSTTTSRALKIENLGSTRRYCPNFEAENARECHPLRDGCRQYASFVERHIGSYYARSHCCKLVDKRGR